MERLADIAAKIDNVVKLEAIVTTIRGLAAARAQEARTRLAAIEAYADVVAAAIAEVLRLPRTAGEPAPPGRSGHVVFTAEQGFAGAFNDRVLDAVTPPDADAIVFLVGTRGALIAGERGLHADWTTPMASHLGGVPAVAERIAAELYRRVEHDGLTRIDLTYAEPAGGGGLSVTKRSLLPLDLAAFASAQKGDPPLTNLPAAALIRHLADEYVYARLCAAATLAFAAENEARLTAMISAKTHVQDTLAGLRSQASQARQREVTEEVVALSASAAARR